MRREVPGGYELDDDRARVDVAAVHRYLADEAYWVRGRDRATIERLVRESTRVIGAYRGDELVGFARAGVGRIEHGVARRRVRAGGSPGERPRR